MCPHGRAPFLARNTNVSYEEEAFLAVAIVDGIERGLRLIGAGLDRAKRGEGTLRDRQLGWRHIRSLLLSFAKTTILYLRSLKSIYIA